MKIYYYCIKISLPNQFHFALLRRMYFFGTYSNTLNLNSAYRFKDSVGFTQKMAAHNILCMNTLWWIIFEVAYFFRAIQNLERIIIHILIDYLKWDLEWHWRPLANPTHQIMNRESQSRFPMKKCSPGSHSLFLS